MKSTEVLNFKCFHRNKNAMPGREHETTSILIRFLLSTTVNPLDAFSAGESFRRHQRAREGGIYIYDNPERFEPASKPSQRHRNCFPGRVVGSLWVETHADDEFQHSQNSFYF